MAGIGHSHTTVALARVDYHQVAAAAARTPGTISVKAAASAAACGCTESVARTRIYRARRRGFDIGAVTSDGRARPKRFDRAEVAALAAATPGTIREKGRAVAVVANISVEAAGLRVAVARDEGFDIGEVPPEVDWSAVAQIASATPGQWKDKAAAIAEQTGVSLACAGSRLKSLRRRGLYTGDPVPRPPKTTPQQVADVACTVPGTVHAKAVGVAQTFQLAMTTAVSRVAAARDAGLDIGVTHAPAQRLTPQQLETAARIAAQTPGTLQVKAECVSAAIGVSVDHAKAQVLAARRAHLDIGVGPSAPTAAASAAAVARTVPGSLLEKATRVASVQNLPMSAAYFRVRYAHQTGLDVGALDDNRVNLAEVARICAATTGTRAKKIRAVASEMGCSRGAATYRVEAAAAAGHDVGDLIRSRRTVGATKIRIAAAEVAAATPGRMADKARAVATTFGCSQQAAEARVWDARAQGLDVGVVRARSVDYDRVAAVCRSAGSTRSQKATAVAEAMGCSRVAALTRVNAARARGFDVGDMVDSEVDYAQVARIACTVSGHRPVKARAVAQAFNVSDAQAASWVSSARHRGLDIGPGHTPVDLCGLAEFAATVPGYLSVKARAVAAEFDISESVARHRLLAARGKGFDIGVAPITG